MVYSTLVTLRRKGYQGRSPWLVGSPEVVVTGTIGNRRMAQCQRSRCEDVGRRRRITLAGQDIENDIGGKDAVGNCLGAGRLHGWQAGGSHPGEGLGHLTIALVCT